MNSNERLELLTQLKASRKAAKGWVTKRGNDIKSLMTDFANLITVKEKLKLLHQTMEDFRSAHNAYHELLTKEDDLEDSNEYISDMEQSFFNLDREINAWLTDAELLYLGINSDAKSDVSASSVGSRASSRASRNPKSTVSKATSSTSSAKARATARKAILEAEAATLKKLQEIEEEELRLRQRKRKLELETKLAKADAEEQAYALLEEKFVPPSPKVENEVRDPSPPARYSQVDIKCPGLLKTEPQVSSREGERGNSHETRDATPKTLPITHNPPSQNEDFLCRMLESQRLQTLNIQHLLEQQQRHTLALTLPQPQVPTFGGDPVEYCTFVRAFDSVIESKTVNERDRLYYLVQYTSGEVQELVRSCLAMSEYEDYIEARRLLRERYGQGYRIATAYVERLTKGPAIKAEDTASLQKFSISLTSCTNTLKEIGYLSKLDNPDGMKKIVDKLPYGLRLKWRDTVDIITQKEHREATIEDIMRFVVERARAAAHPVFGEVANNESRISNVKLRSTAPTARKTTFATQSSPTKGSMNCVLCQQEHWLSQCQAFKNMSTGERSKLVQDKNICGNCLTAGHFIKECPKKSFCMVDGCTGKHSTFLHPKDGKRLFSKQETTSNNAVPQDYNSSNSLPPLKECNNGYVEVEGAKEDRSSKVALAIVPVTVRAKGQATLVKTYAFLDNGSNASFCTDRLLKQLKVSGRKTVLSLTTMKSKETQINCSLVDLEVLDLEEKNHVDLLDVFSTPELPVSTENRASDQDLQRWPHLAGIDQPQIDAEVDLLIGCDTPEALQPKEIRNGRKGEPYATRTIFGWAINGPLGKDCSSTRISNLIKADVNLNKQFKRYCNMEFNDSSSDRQTAMSQEDKRALAIMEDTVKIRDGHYELALPWKHNPPYLDNNKHVAQHRLQLLKKRLLKNPQLLRMYADFMSNLLLKGYARKIPNESLNNPNNSTWYLPHHPVFHPKKPDKVRVVFDCSAKHKGKSLNHQLLQGPDLTSSLFGVLTRFRQETVAFMSDVEAMFHQVRVREEDCDALRFLWWPGGDLNENAGEFQMMVHLFGSASSPSCANFALRKTADDNAGKYDPEATYTVKNNFYVDDCLKLVPTDEAAIRLVHQLRNLLAEGGFNLTKWLSNSAAVLESIPEDERAPSTKTLDFETPHLERALGVHWNVSSDTFGFKINIKDKPATRRGILSIVSSIYDPLGFAAPFTLQPKMLLQDLCRKKLDWDDEIEEEDLQCWKAWLQDLPRLEELSINQCVKPRDFGEVVSSQLHHFSDASQEGYGAVSYLRLVNQHGKIHCSFLTGKSRLAPLKTLTVPRMELSTAVLSTRLDQMLRKELTTPVTETSLFWTDSTCVLSYINNESARYHTFVANRVSSIRDTTSPNQWKYVDTKSNPADDASRGLSPNAVTENLRWIKGPSFLWQPEQSWPQQPTDVKDQ